MTEESDKPARSLRRVIALYAFVIVAISLAVLARGVASTPANVPFEESSRTASSEKAKPEDYALPPESRQKAIEYSRTRYALYFIQVGLSFLIYFLFWRARIGIRFRNWVRRVSSRHFVQALVFVPLFFGVVSLVEFPLEWYSGFVVEHHFDLATQGFATWLADWGKSFAISTAFMTLVIWILYLIIRRSPRRWWFYFWLFTIPVTLSVILLQPLVIDPLFYKFTPLENTRPELTARMEAMLARSGLNIPEQRIFEMNASSKTKTINAYVTGLGSSKRVVIWDNTLDKLTPDEILLVVGHETGHYVLEHIPKEFALIELVALVFIYLGFLATEEVVARWGAGTGLEGVGDLASLPVLFMALTAVSFFADPPICAISRHYEAQADQYGLELAYGSVADPNSADARAFRVMGQEGLDDPDPNPLIKFWLFTHPPLEERIRFALDYKPWAEGKPLELVRPRK